MSEGPTWWTRRHDRLVPRARGPRRERLLAGALFLATLGSVFAVYFWQWQPGRSAGSRVVPAAMFTATLMGILTAHELGHQVVARAAGVRVSPPLFLPFPLLVGTLGAIIRMEGRPRDRTALLWIGASGPLAGACAIAVVILLHLRIAVPTTPLDPSLSAPLVFQLAAWAGGTPGSPDPGDPMAFAAWIGCLVTAMNLLPFGQLDGGHVWRALWPGWAGRATAAVGLLLVVLGMWWAGWWGWLALLAIVRAHRTVEVLDAEAPVRSRWLAAACLVVFVLCFTWVPVGF